MRRVTRPSLFWLLADDHERLTVEVQCHSFRGPGPGPIADYPALRHLERDQTSSGRRDSRLGLSSPVFLELSHFPHIGDQRRQGAAAGADSRRTRHVKARPRSTGGSTTSSADRNDLGGSVS